MAEKTEVLTLPCKWCECFEPHSDQRSEGGEATYCRNGYHDCSTYEPDTSLRGIAMAHVRAAFDAIARERKE